LIAKEDAEYLGITDDTGIYLGADFEITHAEMLDAYQSKLRGVFL
jgi:hypothetical protein